jgi:lipase
VSRPSELLRVTADDGVELQVQRWPAGPDAPVVLVLHGLTANRLGGLVLLEHLPADVELVGLDARGRGLSDAPQDAAAYGHRRNGDDAAAVLRHLGHRDVVVVGHSMGAWDGLQLAAHHPELVRGLVLVDGGFFLDFADGESARDRVDAIMGAGWDARLSMTVPSVDLVLAGFQAHPGFQGIWSDALEEHLRAGLETLPDGTARSRCAAVAAVTDALDYFAPDGQVPYVRADLAQVRCPAVLVRAERGFCLSPETQAPMMGDDVVAAFAQELPGLQVELVPGTNHFSVGYGGPGCAAVARHVRDLLGPA